MLRLLQRRITWGLLLLSLSALGFGYLGAFHPAGDSFAVFRVLFALTAMAAAFVLRRDRRAALCGVAGTLALGLSWLDTLPDKQERRGGQEILLYQQNLLYSRQTYAALLAEITAQDPDVITLQEVSERNLALLEALRAKYPLQQFCPVGAVGGVAVLAKTGRVTERFACVPELGLTGMRVDAGPGPIWLMSLHLSWPWPYRQPEQVAEVTAQLARLEAPIILAGDFNAVGWSHSVHAIAQAGGIRRVGRDVTSFNLPWISYPIGIDHVLATAGQGEVTMMPKFASDHHGILARIYMPQ